VDIRLPRYPPDIPFVKDEVIEKVTPIVEVRPVVEEPVVEIPKKVIPEEIDLIEDEKLIVEEIPEPIKVPVREPEIVEDEGRSDDRDCIIIANGKVSQLYT
jgi:hypothetical protein